MKIQEILEGDEMFLQENRDSWRNVLKRAGVWGVLLTALYGSVVGISNNKPDSNHEEIPLDFSMDDTTFISSNSPREKFHDQEEIPEPSPEVVEKIMLLARTIWGEARNQDREGMKAVAHVIINRTKDPLNVRRGYRLYGKTVEDVIMKSKAFSAWNTEDVNRKLMLAIQEDGKGLPKKDKEAFVMAMEIAVKVMTGETKDPTGGATHYHTKRVKPFWSDRDKVTTVIGDHIFYKNIDS